MRIGIFFSVAAAATALLPHAAQSSPDDRELISKTLAAKEPELIEIRRDIHRHPELSGEEERTAAIVAERLQALGLEVQTGVGGHGVVAVLKGGKPGTVVGYRADMDAVRSNDPDPVDYASEILGVRHICGHDIHITVALGIAEALAALREELPGTVKFIFQPAEESARGARRMLDDGAFDPPTPKAVFAFHTSPSPVGTIGAGVGQALGRRDDFRLITTGEGDLSKVERGTHELVESLNTLDPERAMSVVEEPFAQVRIFRSVPGPEAGQWQVVGQATTSGDSVSKQLKSDLEGGLEDLEQDGLSFELEYEDRRTSGIYNDPLLVESAGEVIRGYLGEENFYVSAGTIPMFSEDFGFFQELAPGVMFWLGVSNPEKGTIGMPHTPDYVADDGAILVGASSMAVVLLDYLQNNR